MEVSKDKLFNEIDSALTIENYSKVAEHARTLLMHFPKQMNADDFIKISTVFGFALLMIGQKEEAIKALQALYKSGMGVVDSSYLLFCMAYEDKNKEEIIEYGRAFVNAIPDPENPPSSLTVATQKAHELINNMSTVLIEDEKYSEAIDFLKTGLLFKKDYPYLYINLGIANLRSGDISEAEQFLLEGLKNVKDKKEISRVLGQFYDENHYFQKAEQHYVNALNEGETAVYIDLGILYSKLFKFKEAEEALENFLQVFPDDPSAIQLVQEVRSHPYYNVQEPKISAALIVKNEEQMIAECIESFREAVDEIVIVDTGSTDKTVEIVKQFEVNLYHHEWKNDFSEARNYSISKATGDWVLIIDADERLAREDIVKVRAAKFQENYDSFCFAVYSSLPGQLGSANFGKHYSPRLFRRTDEHYYYGIVHNLLNVTENIGMSDIGIFHLGYDLDNEKMQNKFERSIKLLLKQVSENPDDPFIRMNTAQMYLSRNYVVEAEEHAKECVRLLEEDPGSQEHLLLMALYQLAILYLRMNKYKESEEYSLKALERKENYIDPLLNLGWCYYLSNQPDEAVESLQKYLDCRKEIINNEEFNLLIVNKLGSDYEALYLMGEIYKQKGDFNSAKEKYLEALESNNLYWTAYNSLGKIYMSEGNYSKAVDAFENAVKYGYLNAEQYGTFGASTEEYHSAIESYREAVEKDVTSRGKKPRVKDALAKVDDILKI